jgi:RNA polymerase sigma-70 factor (ECF subfamily)
MSVEDHLSQIETLWSVVRRAHRDGTETARGAQEELLKRYGGSIRRYLRVAMRDESAADDIYQEFAVRFIRGDFKSVSPERGRFRNFLKTVLFRLVADHYRGDKRRRTVSMSDAAIEPPAPLTDEAEREQEFMLIWRTELLNRAWTELAAIERKTGKPWFTVLRLRVDHPEWRSSELAAELSKCWGRPVTATNLRVMLHRGRDHYADALLSAVAETLDTMSDEQLEQELIDLEILDYCRPALARRRNQTEGK